LNLREDLGIAKAKSQHDQGRRVTVLVLGPVPQGKGGTLVTKDASRKLELPINYGSFIFNTCLMKRN
jgi:hypothetical protein